MFQLYCSSQCTCPRFPQEVFLPALYTIFFPSHWLPYHIAIVKIMDSCQRGMHPVAMTIINPQREYCPSQGSNKPAPVLKYCMLLTVLHGLRKLNLKKIMTLTHSLIHHFETVQNSKKLQTTTEMWQFKDLKIQIAQKTLCHFEQFHLFPQCFPKAFFFNVLK